MSFDNNNTQHTDWEDFAKRLAVNTARLTSDLNDPNADIWREIRRNTGYPNSYHEIKPKPPEQINLPEFRPSFIPQPQRRRNPFSSPPTPSFKNWGEFAEWLEKSMPTNVEIPKDTKPINLQELKKYYEQPNRKPEFKPAPSKPVNTPPELKPLFQPKEKDPFYRLWVMFNYACDNINDKSIRGFNEFYNLGKMPIQKFSGNWPPKYDEDNPGFISHKDVSDITFEDYLGEKINGGDPSKHYAKWSDTDPIYGIKPNNAAGAFVKGYLTRQVDRYTPLKILVNILTNKNSILRFLDKTKKSIEQFQDIQGAIEDVKKFKENQESSERQYEK